MATEIEDPGPGREHSICLAQPRALPWAAGKQGTFAPLRPGELIPQNGVRVLLQK